MLTKSGPWCDVCGDPILIGNCNPFSMEDFKCTLMCHDKCKPFVLEAIEKNDYKVFPPGPLREAYDSR